MECRDVHDSHESLPSMCMAVRIELTVMVVVSREVVSCEVVSRHMSSSCLSSCVCSVSDWHVLQAAWCYSIDVSFNVNEHGCNGCRKIPALERSSVHRWRTYVRTWKSSGRENQPVTRDVIMICNM